MEAEREEVARLVALFAEHGVVTHIENAPAWGIQIVTLTGPDMTRTATAVDVPRELRALAEQFGIEVPPHAETRQPAHEPERHPSGRRRRGRATDRRVVNPRIWKRQIPGAFGADDRVFGSGPPERERARQLLIDAWAAGATWDKVIAEAARYLRRNGATPSHIAVQLDRMRQVQHWRG